MLHLYYNSGLHVCLLFRESPCLNHDMKHIVEPSVTLEVGYISSSVHIKHIFIIYL
jgi:hypothetical protein